jgi:hypothetical protein
LVGPSWRSRHVQPPAPEAGVEAASKDSGPD